MPALIPELVNIASDHTVNTTVLLRRALVAARRLHSTEGAAWLTQELNGYEQIEDVPEYRVIKGQLRVYSSRFGFRDMPVTSAVAAEEMGMCPLLQPIGEVEDWLKEESSVVTLSFPSEQEDILKRQLPDHMKPVRCYTLSVVRGVVDAVRNKVLVWALDLEANGVLGEGMSFTPQEQQQAQQQELQLAPVTHIHIEGGVHGSQVMVNSPESQQQQTVTSGQKEEALAALLPWLQQVIADRRLQQEALTELQVELVTLQAQAALSKPKWPVIGAVANSVRTILEGAGGGVLAAQAVGWLATLTAG